jgi:anti-sigma B factor antagonist
MSTQGLSLDGELTIYRAAALKDQLLAALRDGGGSLKVDVSAVTELDTAGLQVLMAAKQAAVDRGGDLHLTGHSTAVLEVFELCNVAGFFGDPLVIDGQAPNRGTR